MVEGSGGCCIARYHGGGVYDMSKVGQIMLRFRPIAPKPATAGGSVSGGSSAATNDAHVKSGRGKRRYVRDGKNGIKKNGNNKKRKASSEESDRHSGGSFSGGDEVVTLPLLPETPHREDSPARRFPGDQSFSYNDNHSSDGGYVAGGLDRTVVVMPQPVRLVGSIVTVECVMGTWVDAIGFGCNDVERMKSLEVDTCPGFVSDGYDCVGWTNGAYREMVGHKGGGEVVVSLVMKERAVITCSAFTCRVKVQYTCGKERCSMTVPCDVWKLDGGGFAWRLDVEAALSLGR